MDFRNDMWKSRTWDYRKGASLKRKDGVMSKLKSKLPKTRRRDPNFIRKGSVVIPNKKKEQEKLWKKEDQSEIRKEEK